MRRLAHAAARLLAVPTSWEGDACSPRCRHRRHAGVVASTVPAGGWQHEGPSACWLDPSVAVRPSPIDGLGLFAAAPIDHGEIVEVLGGTIEEVDTGGHCCIESESVGEGQRSGGSPYGEAAKNDLKHAIVTAICRVERPSGGSRKG
jgi:hypothetical protein